MRRTHDARGGQYCPARSLPYPDSDRLVGLWHDFPGIGLGRAGQSRGTYLAYQKEAIVRGHRRLWRGDGDVAFTDPTRMPERVPFSVFTASLFQVLRSRPLVGRLFAESDGRSDAPPVAVISERFWRGQLDSDPHVLERTIVLDGTTTQIIGMLPASFAFPASDVRLWVPLSIVSNGYLGGFSSRALGRLRPGVTPAAAQQELQQILLHIAATYPEEAPGLSTASVLAKTRATAVVRPMRDDAVGDFAHILWLVVATVSVLILVAFSNVASLALARAEARQREFAIRTTLGASRARVWWNLVTESAIVSVVGGLAGVGLGLVILAWLARLGPTTLPDPNVAGDGLIRIPRLNEIGGRHRVPAVRRDALRCVPVRGRRDWNVAIGRDCRWG